MIPLSLPTLRFEVPISSPMSTRIYLALEYPVKSINDRPTNNIGLCCIEPLTQKSSCLRYV